MKIGHFGEMQMKPAILILLTAGLAAAETGGLQALPFAPGTDLVRPNVFSHGNFNTLDGWTAGAGQAYDSAVSRTGDGTGSLRLSGIGAETVTSTNLTAAEGNGRRIFRLRAWLKADADPGAAARFRIYIADVTHGGVFYCGAAVSIAGLGDAWKEYTSDLGAPCGLWHVPEIHATDTFRIEVRASNIPSNVRVWVDDITFQPVVRPLVIFPIYPNYRGMLWPDQGTEIIWKAVVDPPEGYGVGDLEVSVQVVRGDSGIVRTVASGALSPMDASGPWISYSVTDMRFEAAGLSDGVYYLRGRLLRKSDGAVLYTYPDYKIVKEDPAAQRANWKAWVDRYNRVVLNGKPRFIWGGFARFTGARNMFVTGSSIPSSNPDNYRRLANGCNGVAVGAPCNMNLPAPTPWNRGYGLNGSTFLKEMGDLKMNTVLVYSAFNAYNVGYEYNPMTGVSASGSIASSGTLVTGTGTAFGTTILAGDAIRIQAPAASGTIANSGMLVTGTDTHFLTEVEPGDLLNGASGGNMYVREVYSDTSLLLGGTSAPRWSNVTFTVTKFRRILSLDGSTQTATIDQPYSGGLSAGTTFAYEKCAPSRYVSLFDSLRPWMTAAQDFDIWYIHNINGTLGADSEYWAYTAYMPRCHLVGRADAAEYLMRSPSFSGAGFLGFHVSDEPNYNDRYKGIANAFEVQRGVARANAGGITEWVDGGIPTIGFDQWNNILDVSSPDPYPDTADNLPSSDDFAYGLASWNKHGRSYYWPRRTAAAVFDSRPQWTTIQLFSWYGGYGYTTSTYPQPSDMKIQIVSSIAAGTTGLMWWQLGSPNRALGDRAEDDYLQFRRASKVVQQLLPILETPVQDLASRTDGLPEYGRLIDSVSDPDIKCSSRRKDTTILLACANTTNVDKAVTIAMKDRVPGKVILPWDGSFLPPAGNSFTVTFRGLNGGTQTQGTGQITNTSGQTVVCASNCNFLAELEPRHTITANGKTRLVISVDSDVQITVDAPVGSAWSNQPFAYSKDSEKENSVQFFQIETQPSASRTQPN